MYIMIFHWCIISIFINYSFLTKVVGGCYFICISHSDQTFSCVCDLDEVEVENERHFYSTLLNLKLKLFLKMSSGYPGIFDITEEGRWQYIDYKTSAGALSYTSHVWQCCNMSYSWHNVSDTSIGCSLFFLFSLASACKPYKLIYSVLIIFPLNFNL